MVTAQTNKDPADETDKIRSTVAKRDNIFQDDYVGFFLDTSNDERKAFEAFFNPLGIQADGVLTEGRGEDRTGFSSQQPHVLHQGVVSDQAQLLDQEQEQ